MKVGQHILITMKENGRNVIGFGKIENFVLVQASPVVVEINKFWGRNITIKHLSNETKNFARKTINCPRKAIIEIDWNWYYLQIQEEERRALWEVDVRKDVGKGREKFLGSEIKSDVRMAADLMAKTYNMVVLELNGRKEGYVYNYGQEMARKQREKKKRAEAIIPKKGDLVIVTNVPGYGKKKYEMIVAAVGPATFEPTDMIRDIMWNNGKQIVPISLPASYVGKLGGTQALAFYTNGFPEKLLYSIVQWTRTGNRNFIKKIPPAVAQAEESMQVEEEVDVVEANKIQRLTEQAIRNQQDSKFHQNDIVYSQGSGDVGRGGDDNVSNTTNFVLAVVGPGSYPNGIVIEDVLVDGKLLTLRADYKGMLTRTEGIAFYTEGIFTNPRWIEVNWRKAMTWNKVYKKRTYEPTKLRF